MLTDLRGFDRTGLAYERVRTAMGNGLASVAHQDHRGARLLPEWTRWCIGQSGLNGDFAFPRKRLVKSRTRRFRGNAR